MKFIRKHRSLFCVFSVLIILLSFSFNTFAQDLPSVYSAGGSYSGNDIYTGNVDYLVSFYSEYADATYSYVVNPCVSIDSYNIIPGFYEDVYLSTDTATGGCWFTGNYFDFECSENFFTSSPPPAYSWFASRFSCALGFSTSDFTPTVMTIEARDFYFLLDPDSELVTSDYSDYLCESILYLDSDPVYSGAAASIRYVEAGVDDSASNSRYYAYSLSSSETNGSGNSSFSVLPTDQSLGGVYSEPTLIYVESLIFTVPLQYNSSYRLVGTYGSYNMDYRNIDLHSYVAPSSPMNPSVFRDYTRWIGTAVGGFLDLQIVDGFTIGGILMVLIAFMITLWFLKVFAGG